tara:strand:+ start:55 stop:921 length:867 start_codon:yes stop_codon:yes gene_type:complete
VEHIRGLKALGAVVTVQHGIVTASAKGSNRRLKGAAIVLDCPSVGATETILMAAVLAEGTTKIENAAQEPEVQDLANLLNVMGAKVTGAGGPVITIEGVPSLHGCRGYAVIPDRIEAGTFLMAAAITRSSMCVEPVVPEHMNAVLQKLRDCGCSLEINGRSIQITPGDIVATDITTQPFPGFPTDLQAPFMALMSTAQGTSVISEKIYENRLRMWLSCNAWGLPFALMAARPSFKACRPSAVHPSPAAIFEQRRRWCWRDYQHPAPLRCRVWLTLIVATTTWKPSFVV